VTNLAVCGIAWGITVLGLLKFTVSWWFWNWPEKFIATLLSLPLELLQWLAHFSDRHGMVRVIQQPPLGMVMLFYLCLMYFLIAKLSLRLRFVGFMAIGGLIYILVNPMQFGRSEPIITIFLPRESIVPVIVIQPPSPLRDPHIINAGTSRFAREYVNWLSTRGVETLTSLTLLDNRVDYYSGAGILMSRLPVRALNILSHDRYNRAALTAICEQQPGRRYWRSDAVSVERRYLSVNKELNKEKKRFDIRVSGFPDWNVLINLSVRINYGCNIGISTWNQNNLRGNRHREWEFHYADRDRLIEFTSDD
jgi:hypothetical protein